MVTAEPPTEAALLADRIEELLQPRLAVVVEVPHRRSSGNLAVAGSLYVQTDPQDPNSIEDWMGWAVANFDTPGQGLGLALALRAHVFTIGEILILDSDGREVAGLGRKPEKWGIVVETFDDIIAAVGRAREVRSW